MKRWFGNIGYSIQRENPPGVWAEDFIVRQHYGDIIDNNRKLQNGESTNDDITVSNKISILSDPFANINFRHMRYAEYMGVKWKITNVNVVYHRLELTLGGEYHDD